MVKTWVYEDAVETLFAFNNWTSGRTYTYTRDFVQFSSISALNQTQSTAQ